jgi:acyl dehydratase
MPLDRTLVGHASDPSSFTYAWRDTVLYALGVGAKEQELDYLYEARGPKVLPTFAVVPKFGPMLELLAKTGGNLGTVIHGSERVVVHAPLPASGVLTTTVCIRGIYDLRRLAQVTIDSRTEDARGQLLAETSSGMLLRGEGGFGGEPPPRQRAVMERPKDAAPTFHVEEATRPEQALVYRLSGDHNPLHADPQFAKSVGFERGPILHGLCTLGFLVRHVAKGVLGGDAIRIRSIEAQFRKPVWPGETLVTEGWVVQDGQSVALQVRVKESGEVVLSGACTTVRG